MAVHSHRMDTAMKEATIARTKAEADRAAKIAAHPVPSPYAETVTDLVGRGVPLGESIRTGGMLYPGGVPGGGAASGEASPAGGHPAMDPGLLRDMLSRDHPAAAGLFDVDSAREPKTAATDMAKSLEGMHLPGYDDPNTPLGKALLTKMRDTYGAGGMSAFDAPAHAPSAHMRGMPSLGRRLVGMLNLESFGSDPVANYESQMAAHRLHARLTGTAPKEPAPEHGMFENAVLGGLKRLPSSMHKYIPALATATPRY
jgi:hypothetical protein